MDDIDQFEPAHEDRVTVLDANFDGTRLLTASTDHRVKVWSRDPKTGERKLIETFTAHDADIRDVRTRGSLDAPISLTFARPNLRALRWATISAQLEQI